MARGLTCVLSAGMVLLALGCGDSNRESSPTSPEFAPSSTGCDLSTARGLVNSVFVGSARQTANNLLQAIQNAGSGSTAATNAGFDLFALIAASRPVPAANGSTFINAIIPCQRVGSPSLPIDFTGALGADGAFDVRGGSSSGSAAVVSHGDPVWGLEPPLNGTTRYTWDQITQQPNQVTTKRFLAFGAPVEVVDSFTNEERVSDVFDWSTVPTLTFTPGVVVGTCVIDDGASYLIQHYSKDDNGQIVPSATPSFCPSEGASREGGLSPFRLARRVLDFFGPQPLLAATLGTRPPGGSIGALSPSAAVNPGQIALQFQGQVSDGRTNQDIVFMNGDDVSVTVTPFGGTKMDGVLVRLIATTNLGATVVATGNEAFTEDGIATFPDLQINKAGGYRLIATIAGFGQNNSTGFDFDNITSNGFNLKQSK